MQISVHEKISKIIFLLQKSKNDNTSSIFHSFFFVLLFFLYQMSYFHASWERQEDIERVDPQAKMKIRRFLQTPQAPGILGTKVCYNVP